MGGNRIEKLKKIMEAIYLALNSKEYDKLPKLAKELNSADFSSLDAKELSRLKKSVDEAIELASKKKAQIVSALSDKEKLKKYKV